MSWRKPAPTRERRAFGLARLARKPPTCDLGPQRFQVRASQLVSRGDVTDGAVQSARVVVFDKLGRRSAGPPPVRAGRSLFIF